MLKLITDVERAGESGDDSEAQCPKEDTWELYRYRCGCAAQDCWQSTPCTDNIPLAYQSQKLVSAISQSSATDTIPRAGVVVYDEMVSEWRDSVYRSVHVDADEPDDFSYTAYMTQGKIRAGEYDPVCMQKVSSPALGDLSAFFIERCMIQRDAYIVSFCSRHLMFPVVGVAGCMITHESRRSSMGSTGVPSLKIRGDTVRYIISECSALGYHIPEGCDYGDTYIGSIISVSPACREYCRSIIGSMCTLWLTFSLTRIDYTDSYMLRARAHGVTDVIGLGATVVALNTVYDGCQ